MDLTQYNALVDDLKSELPSLISAWETAEGKKVRADALTTMQDFLDRVKNTASVDEAQTLMGQSTGLHIATFLESNLSYADLFPNGSLTPDPSQELKDRLTQTWLRHGTRNVGAAGKIADSAAEILPTVVDNFEVHPARTAMALMGTLGAISAAHGAWKNPGMKSSFFAIVAVGLMVCTWNHLNNLRESGLGGGFSSVDMAKDSEGLASVDSPRAQEAGLGTKSAPKIPGMEASGEVALS